MPTIRSLWQSEKVDIDFEESFIGDAGVKLHRHISHISHDFFIIWFAEGEDECIFCNLCLAD